MAKVQYGTAATELSKQGTSGGAAVTIIDSAGNEINRVYTGMYTAFIEVLPSTLTAGTTYFTMRNTGAKTVEILGIEITAGFIGTAATSRSIFSLVRFSNATPTGGTAVTAIKLNNTAGTTSVGDIRYAPGGLTTTSVNFEGAMHKISQTNQLNATYAADVVKAAPGGGLILASGEGFCIRADSAIVSGAGLTGIVVWGEY